VQLAQQKVATQTDSHLRKDPPLRHRPRVRAAATIKGVDARVCAANDTTCSGTPVIIRRAAGKAIVSCASSAPHTLIGVTGVFICAQSLVVNHGQVK
jgi:hypothetical protein